MVIPPRLSNAAIRQKYATENLNLSGKGLEFGAYDRPMFGLNELNIQFADYYSTEELRDFAARDGANPATIAPVSHIMKKADFAEDFPKNFDFIIASHVIEHVADTVGWLQNMHKVLVPGGCAYFVIPDKRYTFDIVRPPSTLGQILERHIYKQNTPGFAAAFDTVYLFRGVESPKVWSGEIEPRMLTPRFDAKKAFEIASDYYHRKDASVHTHVFTFHTFLRIIEELRNIGLISFEVLTAHDVYEPYNEFYVVLKKPEIAG